MPQCAACGKFMGAKEGITCPKCKSKNHSECVRVPAGVTVSDAWRCGDCQSKAPKGRDPSTPIRGMQDSFLAPTPTREEPTTVTSDSKDSTQEDLVSLRTLRQELRSEFQTMQNLMATEFKATKEDLSSFTAEMREIRLEIADTRTSFNDRLNAFEARLEALELSRDTAIKPVEISVLEQALTDMKTQMNDQEQQYLLNDVVITGIPEEKGEMPVHLGLLLGTKMGLTLDQRDIVMAEREGPLRRPKDDTPSQTRRIIIRFSQRSIRDAYLKAARVRRGLTTTDLNIKCSPVRLFVNERLSKINRQLFAKAREQSRRYMWKYCWTKDGRIYVRKEDGTPYSRIRDEKDLDRIFM